MITVKMLEDWMTRNDEDVIVDGPIYGGSVMKSFMLKVVKELFTAKTSFDTVEEFLDYHGEELYFEDLPELLDNASLFGGEDYYKCLEIFADHLNENNIDEKLFAEENDEAAYACLENIIEDVNLVLDGTEQEVELEFEDSYLEGILELIKFRIGCDYENLSCEEEGDVEYTFFTGKKEYRVSGNTLYDSGIYNFEFIGEV